MYMSGTVYTYTCDDGERSLVASASLAGSRTEDDMHGEEAADVSKSISSSSYSSLDGADVSGVISDAIS